MDCFRTSATSAPGSDREHHNMKLIDKSNIVFAAAKHGCNAKNRRVGPLLALVGAGCSWLLLEVLVAPMVLVVVVPAVAVVLMVAIAGSTSR